MAADLEIARNSTTKQRLSIIGRDFQIIEALAKEIHRMIEREYEHTDLRDTADMRGRRFDVKLEDGRVARVTVELDRVEP